MAIYFFDKNQTLIKIVPESTTFEAIQTQELDDDSLLKDTLSVTVKGDEKLLDAEYMAVKSYKGNTQAFDMYRIVTDTTPDKSMSFTGMSLAPYELNGHILQDLRPTNQTISYTLNRILDGTDWRVGYIEDGLTNVTTTFYYVSAKEALKELQSLVGCEFVFKVEISGQKITDKWIEVYSEMGNRTKKRFNYGTNALTVVRETNKADIYTALIGRGKGEEVSSGEDNESGQAGYGRKITFEDIEWSIAKGNPLDKPKGQYYLELPQATQAYGIKNIDGTMKARVGIVDFDDEEDKNRLINLTYQQLLVSSRPKVLFKTTVANVGATGIGDTVTIHRHDLNIHYQTRVRKIVRNKLNDNKTQIELGDAVVTPSTKQTKQNNATIKNLNQEIEKVKADVTTTQTSADGKNTIFYGPVEPERKHTGDTWYRPHPSIAGETQMLVWNGTAWELVIDTSDLTSVSRAVEEADKKADEAVQAAEDSDAKAEAIKQGLGISDINLTNQEITDQIRQDFNSLKSTANTASQAFTDLNNEYQTFLTDKFNPAFTTATTALSLAQQNEGLFYSANLIDEVTGLSNVYTKAEIDGTNGYVTKATFNANAESISSELERVEGVALASGANINLLITRNQMVNTWLDMNHETRPYPTPNETTSPNATSPDLISVTAGEKLTLSKTTTPNDNYFRVDYLDANKQYVDRFSQRANVATITIPANVAYLWVSYPLDSYPKIERGEVKTQWTLAPQDQVNQSTVNYLTSKIEQTPSLITEALTSYTKTDNLDNTVASYLSNNTTKTAQAITNKLSDYQKTSDLDGDIVRLLDNTTTQTAGKFNTKFQALEGKIPTNIGGRNYLLGTGTPKTTTGNVTLNGGTNQVLTLYEAQLNGLEKTVTVSFDYTTQGHIFTTSSTATPQLRIKKADDTYAWILFDAKLTLVYGNRKFVGKITNDALIGAKGVTLQIRFDGVTGGTMTISNAQLENGIIPTGWSYAPEDVATAVQTNEIERTANYTKSAITNVTKDGVVTGSTVNQTKDGITERVARLDTNGNVTYAFRNVKLDSIVSTVANDSYISQIIQSSNLVQSTIRNNSSVDLLARMGTAKQIADDPLFLKGNNGIGVYNLNNDSSVTVTRNNNIYGTQPTGNWRLTIVSSSTARPSAGGFIRGFTGKKYKEYIVKFTAYVPTGTTISFTNNSLGTGGESRWLSDNAGQSAWKEYIYYVRYGNDDTPIQDFGYVYVDNAVTWHVSKYELFDLSDTSYSQITQLQDSLDLKVSDSELLSRINVQAGGVLITSGTNKLNVTPETTYIEDGTIKSAMIESLEAGKIKTGTLDAGKVKVINLDANSITANQANLVKAGLKGSSGGTLELSGDQILSTAKDGSQTYIQNGIVGARNPKGATIGQIGYVFDGGSPTYTIRTTWGSHFGLKQVFYDNFTEGTKEKRVMYASTADDGETTVQFYANSFILHQRKINFGFAHYINGADTNLSITGQSSITLRANESTIFVVSNNGTNNFATLHANLNMAGNTVTNTSDIRLKRDIVNDEIDSLSALMKWQHAGFNYINPDMNQERQFSVIAQSAPDLSSVGEDGYLQVSLNKQVNMTSHALQQHVIKTNDEISKLKAQIASLQDELAQLKGDRK